MPSKNQRLLLNIGWLLKLRWVAVIGQLLTIAGAVLILGIKLLIWPLMVVIGLTVLSNLALIYWYSRSGQLQIESANLATDNTLGLVMTLDMLSLATLLYVTGGPTNPFWLFFFVNLSLSAVMLTRNWAWSLNLLSIALFAGLQFRYVPVDELSGSFSVFPVSGPGTWTITQSGMLLAFTTCSSVIVYFMTRVTGELRQQELDLRAAQENRSRNEKLEALGTLAAGAAHELATPLTTIALVAKDVEQSIRQSSSTLSDDDELIEDVGLIRQQLDRCKSILDRMSSHAGETVGEMMRQITVGELVNDVCQGLTNGDDRLKLDYQNEKTEHSSIEVPVDALSQAIRGLVQNALDASDPDGNVCIRVQQKHEKLVWAIQDQGTGMAPEVLRRVSEPFFTTKQPGKGMGLGVFLARNVIESVGGTVHFESSCTPSSENGLPGTTVTVTLPLPLDLSNDQSNPTSSTSESATHARSVHE